MTRRHCMTNNMFFFLFYWVVMISSVELVSLCFLKLEHLPKWLCASKLKRSDGGDGALLNYALARKTICARDFTLPYYYSMIERLSIVFYNILPQRDYFLSSIHICNALKSCSKWRRRWWGASIIFGQRNWLWAWKQPLIQPLKGSVELCGQ